MLSTTVHIFWFVSHIDWLRVTDDFQGHSALILRATSQEEWPINVDCSIFEVTNVCSN
jgi:hypothetical protein